MRARLLIGTLVIFTSLVLSGCLDEGLGGKSGKGKNVLGKDAKSTQLGFLPDWAELALAGGTDHDHKNILQHGNRSTPNFQTIGYNPLITDYSGKTSGGHFCGAVQEKDGRRISVVHSWVSDVAFIVSDVTDPTNPLKIGEFVMANTHVYDLALTEDMKTVLLATSPGTNSIGNDPEADALAWPEMYFRDACTGEERRVMGPEQGIPFASGIVVVDISNPRVPQITDFRFFPPSGGHSVVTKDIGGRPVVLVSQSSSPGYYVFAELLESQAGRKFNILSVYQYAAQTGTPAGVQAPVPIPGGLHDAFLHKHPKSGTWLAYLAYGSSSLVILDITDLRQPKFLSRWADWSKVGKAAPNPPFVHEAIPMDELWEGRHITFIGEECGGRRAATPTCLIAAIDTTDPTKPTFESAWTLPAETGSWGGAMFSPHYLAVQNRTLFVTMYHGGVWAVDVSTPEALHEMPTIGVFLPDRQSPKPIGRTVPYNFGPVVLDILPLSDGSMIVYDGMTGLYTVRFDATNKAPSPDPWPLGYNEQG